MPLRTMLLRVAKSLRVAVVGGVRSKNIFAGDSGCNTAASGGNAIKNSAGAGGRCVLNSG